MSRLAVHLLLVFWPVFGLAPAAREGVRQASSGPAATAAALQWMSGSWAGTAGGLASEEHWTGPRGGTLLGMHRDVREGRTVAFEYIRIEERAGTLQYVASPGGQPPTVFPLAEIGPERVVFENPSHDFPQRILYWKEGQALRARVEGRVGGRLESEEWRWQASSLRAPELDR